MVMVLTPFCVLSWLYVEQLDLTFWRLGHNRNPARDGYDGNPTTACYFCVVAQMASLWGSGRRHMQWRREGLAAVARRARSSEGEHACMAAVSWQVRGTWLHHFGSVLEISGGTTSPKQRGGGRVEKQCIDHVMHFPNETAMNLGSLLEEQPRTITNTQSIAVAYIASSNGLTADIIVVLI